MPWPPFYQHVALNFDVLNLNVASLASASCAVNTNFYDKLWAMTMGPIMLSGAIFLYLIFGKIQLSALEADTNGDGQLDWSEIKLAAYMVLTGYKPPPEYEDVEEPIDDDTEAEAVEIKAALAQATLAFPDDPSVADVAGVDLDLDAPEVVDVEPKGDAREHTFFGFLDNLMPSPEQAMADYTDSEDEDELETLGVPTLPTANLGTGDSRVGTPSGSAVALVTPSDGWHSEEKREMAFAAQQSTPGSTATPERTHKDKRERKHTHARRRRRRNGNEFDGSRGPSDDEGKKRTRRAKAKNPDCVTVSKRPMDCADGADALSKDVDVQATSASDSHQSPNEPKWLGGSRSTRLRGKFRSSVRI